MTESTQDAGTRRGRPRPKDTIDRDEMAYRSIAAGPKTTGELATDLGVAQSIAYLCIHRLKRDGRIIGARVDGVNRWSVVAE